MSENNFNLFLLRLKLIGENYSPLKLMLITAFLIFIVELLLMVIETLLPPFPPFLVGIFDAFFLIILILPALYILNYKPMSYYISELIQSKSELRKSNEALESINKELLEDISERIRLEKTMIKLYNAVENTADSVFITDKKGIIEYVNPAFEKLTGFSKEDSLGKTPKILKSGLMEEKYYEKLWSEILAGNDYRACPINKKKNGELYYVEQTISPIKDNQGEIINFVSTNKDITEQKKTELELIKAKEKAEEMNRLKSNFLANMSHELRTPMIGIISFSKMMEKSNNLNDIKEMSGYVWESSKRLMETLNLILDLSKIESGLSKLVLQKEDLIEILEKNFMLFDPIAKEKNLYLNLNTRFQNLFSQTDASAVNNIIGNLIGNALKFTDKGGVSIFIDVKIPDSSINSNIENEEQWIVIEISDTGIGIPEDSIEYIFQEFRQASEGLSRSHEGTGLGLTLTKKYVELLGGSINVKSVINKGSTFIVRLPLKPVMNEIDEYISNEISNSDITASSNVNINKKSVLIVEDDLITIKVVKRILADISNVESAMNSMEALQKVESKQFDAILMDINLGRSKNGVYTTKEIRKLENYKDIPIIAMTAYAMFGDKEEFLAAGCSHYISKPFNDEELIALVKEVLDK